MLNLLNMLGLGLILALNPFGLIKASLDSYELVGLYAETTVIYQDSHYYSLVGNKKYDLGEDIYYNELAIISNQNDGLYLWNNETYTYQCFVQGDFSHVAITLYNEAIIISGTTHYNEDNYLYNYKGNSDNINLNNNLTQGFIISMDQNGVWNYSHVYESDINEGFTACCVIDDILYVGGFKGMGDGALTSQGSLNLNTIMYQFDRDFNCLNYSCLPHSEYINKILYDTLNERFILSSSHNIILLDKTGEYKGYIADTGHTVDTFNGTIVVFKEDCIVFYDSYYGLYLDTINLDKKLNIVHKNSVSYYCYGAENYLCDIYDTRDFYIPEPLTETNESLIISSCFGSCLYKGENSPDYTPLIDGVYDRIFNFQTPSGYDFQIKVNTTVEPFQNVVEQGVYPLGYTLSFTGNATLNGENVYNNYKCGEGQYTLTLTSQDGSLRTIHFSVCSLEYNYQDYVQHYDIVSENEYVNWAINPLFNNMTIELNGKEEVCESMENDEGYCVSLKGLTKGYNVVRIKALGKLKFNYTLTILYVAETPTLTLSAENSQINIETNDEDGTLRALRVIYASNQEEIYQTYELNNNTITLEENNIKDLNTIKVELLYNLGDGHYDSISVAHYDVNLASLNRKTVLFKVKVELLNNHLTQITLLPQTGLTRAKECIGYMANQMYYKESQMVWYMYGLFCLGGLTLGTLAFIIIRKKRK